VAGLMEGRTDASELPRGAAIWEDTQVSVPAESAASYRNIFTGEDVVVKNGALTVGEALPALPVALLWAESL
jgi:maltooligosyltrehalose synthase